MVAAPAEARGAAGVEAAVRTAVVQGNVAWTRALQTASPAGLAAFKTGDNLTAALQSVAQLQSQGEYYRIALEYFGMIWIHVLSATHAQVLAQKIGEFRALYRRGQTAPLDEVDESYFNLYDLSLVDGHWLTSSIHVLDEPSAARLVGPLPGQSAVPPTPHPAHAAQTP
jgi:hypothetical protein